MKKTSKIVITGLEPRNTSLRNSARHGIFFNFYSRPCGKVKDETAWKIKHGQNIPKWVLMDIIKQVILHTKDMKQLNKFKRAITKTEKKIEEIQNV